MNTTFGLFAILFLLSISLPEFNIYLQFVLTSSIIGANRPVLLFRSIHLPSLAELPGSIQPARKCSVSAAFWCFASPYLGERSNNSLLFCRA
jgi:hypothetical protein